MEEYRGIDSHVQIPPGVEWIGVQEFSRCECVERISLHGGIQFIEAGAFEYCTNLRSVIMTRGLERIDE